MKFSNLQNLSKSFNDKKSKYDPSIQSSMIQPKSAKNGQKQIPENAVKSILKNQSKQESLANQYNISRKDPISSYKDGLGLTPNLNVEDQYVENLLKQIHFMNLEIKLLKEKQEENKGRLGIAGLLSKDGKPIVEHIQEAAQKYANTKEELTLKDFQQEQELLQMIQNNHVLLNERDEFKKIIDDLKANMDEMCKSYEQKITDQRKKFNEEHEKKLILEQDLNKQNIDIDKATVEHTKLVKNLQREKFLKGYDDDLLTQQENKEKDDEKFKKQLIEDLTNDIEKIKYEMENNVRYQRLLQETNLLKAKLKELERDKVHAEYEALEKDELNELSVKQKQKESDDRRKIQQEVNQLKNVLKETQIKNQLIIDQALALLDSKEIKKKSEELQKLKNELRDLTNNFEQKADNYRNKKQQMIQYQYDFNLLDFSVKEQDAQLQAVLEEKNKLEAENIEITKKLKDLTTSLAELKEEKDKKYEKFREQFAKRIELETRYAFLNEHVDLDDTIKKVNLEQLNSAIDSNKTITDSIGNFYKFWDNIKKIANSIQDNRNIPNKN